MSDIVERPPARADDTSRGPARAELENRANDIIPFEDYWGKKGYPPWHKVRKLTIEQMGEVIDAVARGQSLITAARNAGTTLWSIQRQRIADVGFGMAMNDALRLRQALLEEKAIELAYEGQEEIMEKGGSSFSRTTYPNANLLQFLLKAYFPEKFGVERKEIKAGPLETAPDQIRSNLDRKRLRERLQERMEERRQEAIDVQAVAVADEVDNSDLF